ncbi:ComEC/Rec2 family competence protein [Arthrobacter sp. I2-34]|uniref:ComEC/Rec2 family competence protein n=1 Tax=Arthrobacter hankyongi TaxID=2904801 RepID=A0ABS9L6D9_9MICC|nr:ComEC/Rec2 family competence protein [Arthrobacter hankyongi]MCG2622241.1 ComEC/Rec2 family competence protein [Arthrobacter hankyongi]
MSRSAPWRRFADAASAGPVAEARAPAAGNTAGGALPAGTSPARTHLHGPALLAAAVRARAGFRPATGSGAVTLDFRLAAAAGVCWATALGLPHAPRGTAFVLAALLFAAVLAMLLRMVFRPSGGWLRATGLVLCSAAALAALVLGIRQAERLSGPIRQAVDAGATVTVRLTAHADAARTGRAGKFPGAAARYQFRAEIHQATFGGRRFAAATPVLLIGDSSWAQARYGDELAAAGKLVRAGAGPVEALLIASTGFRRVGVPPVAAAVNALREAFIGSTGTLPPDARALLPGMVLGDRSQQPEDLAEAMRIAGLTHLMAVSGANCSYVLGAVYLLAALCRLPRPLRGLLGLVALGGFVILVRPEPSVLRAAAMGSIGVFALLAGRRRASLAFLCLSVIVLLLADPWLAASYGFLLSVLATLGLVLFGERCSRWLQRFLPKLLADALSLPLAAQVFCTPVVVMLQPGLPLYAVAANVLAAPVVPVVTISGMAAVMLAPVWPWMASIAVQLAGGLCLWVGLVARMVAVWPAASFPWPEGVPGAVLALLAGLLVLSLLFLGSRLPAAWHRSAAGGTAAWLQHRRRAHAGRLLPHRGAAIPAGIRHGSARHRTALLLGLLGLAAAASGIAVAVLARGGETPKWVLAVCDVGQGDGLVLNAGEGSAVVVDTGPEPAPMDRCLRRLGVDRIELLVLTHMHLDHYGGLAGALDHRKVGTVLVGSSRAELPDPVVETLADAGATAQRGSAGMAGSYGSLRWEVLWPGAGRPPPEENDASLVLRVDTASGPGAALTMLLTGDLESEAAAALLARLGPALPAVDVLKISHHGARNGGSRLIQALRPKAAVISAGRGNDYGHPAPEILAALEREQVPVFRTDLLGTILLSADGGRLEIAALR